MVAKPHAKSYWGQISNINQQKKMYFFMLSKSDIFLTFFRWFGLCTNLDLHYFLGPIKSQTFENWSELFPLFLETNRARQIWNKKLFAFWKIFLFQIRRGRMYFFRFLVPFLSSRGLSFLQLKNDFSNLTIAFFSREGCTKTIWFRVMGFFKNFSWKKAEG